MTALIATWTNLALRAAAIAATVTGAFVASVLYLDPIDDGLVWWQAAFVGAVSYGLWFGITLASARLYLDIRQASPWWMTFFALLAGAPAGYVGVIVACITAAALAWHLPARAPAASDPA